MASDGVNSSKIAVNLILAPQQCKKNDTKNAHIAHKTIPSKYNATMRPEFSDVVWYGVWCEEKEWRRNQEKV